MEDEKTAQEIKKRFTYLERLRNPWDTGIWQDIDDYVFSISLDLKDNKQAGKVETTKMYDGTAISAVNLAADGTHGYMINPATMWFNAKLPRELVRFENNPDVREWLQDGLQEGLYSAYRNSNFYSEMRTFLRDVFSIGHAVMYMEEDILSGKIVFTCIPTKEVYLAEDKFRNIDTCFRKVKLTARQVAQQFDKKNISQPILNALENNPYQEFTFLHAVFPRTDFDDRKITSVNKRYASIWCEYNSNNILRKSGYDIFPYMTWRYAKCSNSAYAYSPATFALPEIKALNAISKDLLGAAQLSVRPAMNIPIEMKGKVRLTPFGMNYYGSDYNRKISPINQGGQFPFALDREEKKREIIEKHFHTDLFLMFQRVKRQMTATETMERMGENAAVLAASIGDLTTTLDKINDYASYIEFRAGRIPSPPDILMEYGGSNIDIVYIGPLAQAQKRLFETQGIRMGLELAIPLLAVFPETVDLINADETLKQLLISNGFPQTAFNAPEKIMTIRQQKSDQRMQEVQKLDQERIAEVLKKLAQASKNANININELMPVLGQS